MKTNFQFSHRPNVFNSSVSLKIYKFVEKNEKQIDLHNYRCTNSFGPDG